MEVKDMVRLIHNADADGVQLMADAILKYISDPECDFKCTIYHNKIENSIVMVIPNGEIYKKKKAETDYV
jgi:hypothetical protein